MEDNVEDGGGRLMRSYLGSFLGMDCFAKVTSAFVVRFEGS